MDRISRLPDEVLCHILSFLPTKHAAATSVLSSRWVYLWLSLPVIDLDDSLYINQSRKDPKSELFIRFLDMVSFMNLSETIVKFRLHMRFPYGGTLSEINGFIQNVFLRNVVELDLAIFSKFYEDEDKDVDDDDEDNYLYIPHSKSLKVLKVRTRYCLKLPVFPGCFPALRVFDAKFSVEKDDELITNLFPCLPALEKLCLVVDLGDTMGEYDFNIGGAALKHLELRLLIYDYDGCDAKVVIDAPQLEYLRLQDTFLASYLVKNTPSIGEVRLDVGEDNYFLEVLDESGPTRLTRFNELLQGLVNAKSISVSAATIMVIFSQEWNLPVLPYLTKLELDVPASGWRLLLDWLERCPNLRVLSLIIKENHGEEFEEVEWMVPDVVPSCLSSRIKEIEIKRLGKVDDEEMFKYLLCNATVLGKFTVDSHVYTKDFWKVCL